MILVLVLVLFLLILGVMVAEPLAGLPPALVEEVPRLRFAPVDSLVVHLIHLGTARMKVHVARGLRIVVGEWPPQSLMTILARPQAIIDQGSLGGGLCDLSGHSRR